ncbi:FIST signal transduction protein, partial [Desulfobacula sp.]
MLKVAMAVSDDIDVKVAVESVLRECSDQMAGELPQVGILFTSCMDADFTAMLARITTYFQDIDLIGCTTSGELTSKQGFSEDSVALLLLTSDTVHFATSVAQDISKNPERSIHKAFEKCKTKLGNDPVCAIVLPDGLTIGSVPLDRLLCSVMGESFPVFGGLASDQFKLVQTFQFCGDKVYSDAMPVLLFGGDLTLSAGVFTGPVPFGPFYEIDRFEKNIIHSIDGKTVKDFYIKEFGDLNAAYSNFPLAVYPENDDNYFLRSPFQVDEDSGSMTFLGTFPEKFRVRMSMALREDIRRSAEKANEKLLSNLRDQAPELILIFPCTSRRHVLGSETY